MTTKNNYNANANDKKEAFSFMMDEKHTVWQRTAYTVEAKTREEAEKLAIEVYKSGEVFERASNAVESETLFETMFPMTEKENGGQSVLEIACQNDESIDFVPIKS